VADYNHRRYHESIHNLTPADVYCGRGQIILRQRERINARPSLYAACSTNGEPRNLINQTSQSLPPFALLAVSKTLMTDSKEAFPLGRYARHSCSPCGCAGSASAGDEKEARSITSPNCAENQPSLPKASAPCRSRVAVCDLFDVVAPLPLSRIERTQAGCVRRLAA
jgi:hypothetical protein